MNAEKIKLSMIRAIAASPTNVEIKRIPKVSDGMNGFKNGSEITVVEIDAFLDESKAKLNTLNSIDDSGVTRKIEGIELLVPYGNYELKIGDYFSHNNTKYTIRLPINMYDIFWQCTVEVEV